MTVQWEKTDERGFIYVTCPCCKAVYAYHGTHPVHTKDQFALDLTHEQAVSLHPEVSEDEEEESDR